MYTLHELQNTDVDACINSKWVPARPLPFYGWAGLKWRIRDAWEVFRGRADAFKWPEGQ